MRTFGQKPKATQQGASAGSAVLGRAHFRHVSQTHAEEAKAGLTDTTSIRFGHDFSRIPIHPRAAGAAQTKLPVSHPGDEHDREADRVSEQVLRMPEPQHRLMYAHAGGRPERAGQGPVRLRMKHGGGADSGQAEAPPVVQEVLRSHGQPLDPSTRAFFESRFGHDLSHVRVHSHASAQQSARELNAQAYTVGSHIVFGASQYAPGTQKGRRLIAHELAHVLQQRAGALSVQRKINVDDFDAGKFDQMTIRNYLFKIEGGKIEGNSDSDDKARFIVRQWRMGKPMPLGPDELEAKTKVTLIREMQSGFTGDDDERAILALLLNSSDRDLEIIFAPGRGGIDPKDLDSDFQGGEEDVLRAFYDRKFEGGRKAALAGSRKLRSQQQAQPQKPVVQGPWRELARKGVPFDQWSLEEKKRADDEYRATVRRTGGDQTVHDWLQTRDADNELFRLLHPYHNDLRAFFERRTYARLEPSSNPARSGEEVTFTAFVNGPAHKTLTGEVEFTYVDMELSRIYGHEVKYVKKVALKDSKAIITTKMYHTAVVTVTYPDTGDLVGSETSVRVEVTP